MKKEIKYEFVKNFQRWVHCTRTVGARFINENLPKWQNLTRGTDEAPFPCPTLSFVICLH